MTFIMTSTMTFIMSFAMSFIMSGTEPRICLGTRQRADSATVVPKCAETLVRRSMLRSVGSEPKTFRLVRLRLIQIN